MEVTQIHNYFLDKFRGKVNTTIDQIKNEMKKSEYYVDATDEEIDLDAEKIFEKLQIINQEFMKWYEILLSFIFALIVFEPLVEQFTTGISLLFVLIYAIVAYILAATYVFFYKNYIVKNIGKSIIIFRNLSEKDGLSKNVWKFRVD